ncbi:MAG: hypothetical protein M3014_02155 [Chloroflexota bacterium]|nr:hypothetical protein [Chloroflexota bacterium]
MQENVTAPPHNSRDSSDKQVPRVVGPMIYRRREKTALHGRHLWTMIIIDIEPGVAPGMRGCR